MFLGLGRRAGRGRYRGRGRVVSLSFETRPAAIFVDLHVVYGCIHVVDRIESSRKSGYVDVRHLFEQHPPRLIVSLLYHDPVVL